MSEGAYFTFPLSVIRERDSSPLQCMELVVKYGIINAGLGYRNIYKDESFKERYLEVIEENKNIKIKKEPDIIVMAAVVGASICNVICNTPQATADIYKTRHHQGVFVKMKASFVWAAINYARWENDPITNERPEKGISWREFRILAAILSAPKTKEGIRFPSIEDIRVRAHGHIKRDIMKTDELPDQLLPRLTAKQVRETVEKLENLNFFARFRLSTSQKGGKMYYSFRHKRPELAKAVIDLVNFRDRQKVAQNRAEDLENCLGNLGRAKSGKSPDKVKEKDE